jgi:hypothetical protein
MALLERLSEVRAGSRPIFSSNCSSPVSMCTFVLVKQANCVYRVDLVVRGAERVESRQLLPLCTPPHVSVSLLSVSVESRQLLPLPSLAHVSVSVLLYQ